MDAISENVLGASVPLKKKEAKPKTSGISISATKVMYKLFTEKLFENGQIWGKAEA